MRESRAYFVSDIHLKSMHERNGEILLRFLHSLAKEDPVPDLYFLGDIFDLWISGHSVFVEKFKPLMEPLQLLKKRGAKLVYFEGNHDLHLHPYWEKDLGFEVFSRPEYRQIGSFLVRLEHGDQMNPDDTAYLRWRAFSRHRVMEFLAHTLPGSFWSWLGERMSAQSRQRSRTYRRDYEEVIRDMIRRHGLKAVKEKKFDVLISGHMHVWLDENSQSNEGNFRNINLGSWLEASPRALVICGSEIQWVSLDHLPAPMSSSS
jgi:UDP-2,3-diacylglucosamine hydrolase